MKKLQWSNETRIFLFWQPKEGFIIFEPKKNETGDRIERIVDSKMANSLNQKLMKIDWSDPIHFKFIDQI